MGLSLPRKQQNVKAELEVRQVPSRSRNRPFPSPALPGDQQARTS